MKSTSIAHRPDINALRDRQVLAGTATNTNQLTTLTFQPPALEDLEAPRRQTSLDGEAIKIIIHDVDSGPFFAAKRRVTLRRDPTDKAHRSIFSYIFYSYFSPLFFGFLFEYIVVDTWFDNNQLCCVNNILQTHALKMSTESRSHSVLLALFSIFIDDKLRGQRG